MPAAPLRRRRFRLPFLALAFLLFGAIPATQAAEPALVFPAEFSIPAGMEGRVRFWVDVFAHHSLSDAILHDREQPERVLAVVRMKRGNRRERQQLLDRYRGLLRDLAGTRGEERQRRVAAFSGPLELDALDIPPERLRVHRGQSEVFSRGLGRSRFYARTVRKELARRGLPPLLLHLPQIESSWNPRARSKAGAVGLWQLMPRTARQYIRVSRSRDERRNPQRSTYAAARYLESTHRTLGNWPLALTAYNHGPSAMLRAVDKHGTADLGELIEVYEGRRFGFAGRNFYAQFLAAAHIGENVAWYFPDVDTSEVVTHTVERGDTLWDIARLYGVTVGALKRANAQTLSRSRYLKPGVRLVVEG